jgi:hypothetical protein
VSALTQPADLNATISNLFGHVSHADHGQNLIPLCQGQIPSLREYACAAMVNGESKSTACTTTGWKLLSWANSAGEAQCWLFRQPEDRFGMLDLHHQLLEYAERLESCMHSYLSAARAPGPLEAPKLPAEQVENQTTSGGTSP